MKEIENYIHSYFGIGGKDLSPVSKLFTNEGLNKNEFFLKEGQYSKKLSFVKSGYLRVSAFSKGGDKEITQWITGPGEFATDLSSFIFDTPVRWNICALSDCELYTIHDDNYKKINLYVKNWPELEKLFITKCFITMEHRIFNLLSMTAEEKYHEMFSRNPEIFNQVPLQYIASLLGMTPETLSRIRKKMVS